MEKESECNVSEKYHQSDTLEKSEFKIGNTSDVDRGPLVGIRHLQCFLLFFALTVAYALRVNLSLAVVAMTDKSSNPNFPEYHWDESTKGLVLSSFFWGYVITQVPGGQLAEKFGGKITLFIGILICSILNMATPFCVPIGGWKLVCVLRVIQGLCQGVIFPSTHILLAKWSPLTERSRLGTWTYAGGQFGTVLMLASSGLLAASPLGWPGIFYISGGVGVVWSAAWFWLGAKSPQDFKNISNRERDYIEESQGKSEEDKETKTHVRTPWIKIFTSLPFISLIVAHAGNNWGFWTLMTEIPTYMRGVLGQDIKSNALLSALPYLTMMLASFVFSYISDTVLRRKLLSLTASRKVFNTIAHWTAACSLIALGYVGHGQTTLAVSLLTITVGINSATYSGFQINHIDLAPNHAGTLMGITNCVANVMSIMGPLVVGAIVIDQNDATQWRIVFFIAAAIFFLGNLTFITFGKAVVQSWNESDETSPSKSVEDGENCTSKQNIKT